MQLQSLLMISIIAAKFHQGFVSRVHAIANDPSGHKKIIELTRDQLIHAAQDGAVVRAIVDTGQTGHLWKRLSVIDVQGTPCLKVNNQSEGVDDLGDVRHI